MAGELGLAGPMPVWTATADGRPYGVPHVGVTVNGHPVDVMLDTGASQHFLLDAAAWAYDVRSQSFGALATDAHGARFAVRLAEPGCMRVQGRPFHSPAYVFLLESRALFETGVLGGVAPQLLAPAGYASVLDLAAGRLDVVRDDRRGSAATEGSVCGAGPDSRDGWRYVVPVRVGGGESMLLLDTGAEHTTVYGGSPLAAALVARPDGGSIRVAGAASVVEMRVLDGVPLEVGGAAFEGRVTVGPGQAHCGEDGLLGFDALRRCRVSMSAERLQIECASGEPPLHRAPPRPTAEAVVLTRVDADAACGLSAEALRPGIRGTLPHGFASAIDAYVALAADVSAHAERIETSCMDAGYLGARVREPVIERQGAEIAVRFSVDEGQRFMVRSVTVSLAGTDGSRRLSADDLGWLSTQRGRPYRRADAVADTRALADALAARGAAVSDAGFGRAPSNDATVDVHFVLTLAGSLPTEARIVPALPIRPTSF